MRSFYTELDVESGEEPRLYHATLAEDYDGSSTALVKMSTFSTGVAAIEVALGDVGGGHAIIPAGTPVTLVSVGGRIVVQSLGVNEALLLCDEFDRDIPAGLVPEDSTFSLGDTGKGWSWGETYSFNINLEMKDGILKLRRNSLISFGSSITFYIHRDKFNPKKITLRFRLSSGDTQEIRLKFTTGDPYYLYQEAVFSILEFNPFPTKIYLRTNFSSAEANFVVLPNNTWYDLVWNIESARFGTLELYNGETQALMASTSLASQDEDTGILGIEQLNHVRMGTPRRPIIEQWKEFSLSQINDSDGFVEIDYIRTEIAEELTSIA